MHMVNYKNDSEVYQNKQVKLSNEDISSSLVCVYSIVAYGFVHKIHYLGQIKNVKPCVMCTRLRIYCEHGFDSCQVYMCSCACACMRVCKQLR